MSQGIVQQGFAVQGLAVQSFVAQNLVAQDLVHCLAVFYIKKIISVTMKNAAAVRAGCFSQFLGLLFSIIRMTAENIR